MDSRVFATSNDDSLQYVSLTSDKLEEALEVIRNGFFIEESISVAVGLSKHPEAIRELDELIIDAAMDGISTIAVEKATGKVAGCLINKMHIKANESQNFFEKFKFNCRHPTARTFLEVNTELDNIIDAFSLLQTDCYLETMSTGILPEFRRRGIAKKLQAISLEIVQNLRNGNNVKVALNGKLLPLHPVPTANIGFPTSPIMKKILVDLGYKFAIEIDFRKYKLQNNMLPLSAIAKIPPICLMCKHF